MRGGAARCVARGQEAQGVQVWALDIRLCRRSLKAARRSREIVHFAVSSLSSLPTLPAGFRGPMGRYLDSQLPIGLCAPGGPGELMSYELGLCLPGYS